MPDTPITRAARALCLAQSGADCYDSLEPEAQEQARETVRAVIGAIREPSEGMVRAIDARSYGQPRAVFILDEDNLDTAELLIPVYQAMIDKALSE